MVSEGTTRGWLVAPVSPERREARVVRSDADTGCTDTALSTLDEAALVASAVGGCREAFDVIVARHQRAVYHVCYRFAGNHEDASDLAQEAFVRAWRGLPRFKRQAALSTWLYRIAVNVCLTHAASRAAPTESLVARDYIDPNADDPRSSLVKEERAAAVRRAIHALPRKQRATLVLRAYHDLSHKQIAEILGSSVGTVKANFFHALANLKKSLGSEP